MNNLWYTIDDMSYECKNTVYTKFYNEIFPKLAEYEKERVRELTKFIVILVIGIGFPILYFGCFALFLDITQWLASFNENFGIIFLLGGFAASVFLPVFAIERIIKIKNNFKRKIKHDFTDEACCLFGKLQYVPGDNVMKHNELAKSSLFSMFNSMYPDDSFIGEYKGVKYRISELKLAQEGRKGGWTNFKGVVISFNSNKKIKALTTVVTKSDFNSGNGLSLNLTLVVISLFIVSLIITVLLTLPIFIEMQSFNDLSVLFLLIPVLLSSAVFPYIIFSIFKQNKDYIKDITSAVLTDTLDGKNLYKNYTKSNGVNNHEIKLEDVKFAKKFKAFSDDEVEARYLVTSAFMERFLNMTTAFGTNKAKCAFCGNQIIFAITTRKDLFELGSLFKPLSDTKNIGMLNELMSILEMIDYFKLDEKTGL